MSCLRKTVIFRRHLDTGRFGAAQKFKSLKLPGFNRSVQSWWRIGNIRRNLLWTTLIVILAGGRLIHGNFCFWHASDYFWRGDGRISIDFNG